MTVRYITARTEAQILAIAQANGWRVLTIETGPDGSMRAIVVETP